MDYYIFVLVALLPLALADPDSNDVVQTLIAYIDDSDCRDDLGSRCFMVRGGIKSIR